MSNPISLDGLCVCSRMRDSSPYIIPTINTAMPIKYKLDILESYPRPTSREFRATSRDFITYPCTLCNADSPRQSLIRTLTHYWHIGNPARDPASNHIPHIMLTHGSDNALRLIFETFGAPDSARIVMPIPTYPHAQHFAQEFARQPIVYLDFAPLASHEPIPRHLDDNNIAQFMASIRQKVTPQTSGIIYLANPNLPLGYVIPTNTITQIAREFPQMIIVVDQAYIEFGASIHCREIDAAQICTDLSPPHLPPNMPQNIIITRTFSKFYALADLRIGYLVTYNEAIARVLTVWYNMKDVSEFSAHCALCAFSDTIECANTVAHYRAQSAYVRAQLATNCAIEDGAEIYNYSFAFGNFYLLFARNPAATCAAFAARGIQVRDKSQEIPGAIRVGISSPAANRAVMRAIWAINAPYVITHRNNIIVALDLDGTLRPHSWTNITPEAQKLLSRLSIRATIVTNNTSSEAHALLMELHNTYGARIISPITQIARIIGDRAAYCICDVGLQQFARQLMANIHFDREGSIAPDSHQLSPPPVRAIILMDSSAILSANQYVQIGQIMARANEDVDIYVAESARVTTIADCSCENLRTLHCTYSSTFAPIMMPDMGAIADQLAHMYPRARIHRICKPYFAPIPCDYFIGNSETDRLQEIRLPVADATSLKAHIIIQDPTQLAQFVQQ